MKAVSGQSSCGHDTATMLSTAHRLSVWHAWSWTLPVIFVYRSLSLASSMYFMCNLDVEAEQVLDLPAHSYTSPP